MIGEAASSEGLLTWAVVGSGLLPLAWLAWRHLQGRPVLRVGGGTFVRGDGVALGAVAFLLMVAYFAAGPLVVHRVAGPVGMVAGVVAPLLFAAGASFLFLRRVHRPRGSAASRLAAGLVVVWAVFPVVYGLLAALQGLGAEGEQDMVTTLRNREPYWEVLALFAVAVAPAVEEVVFRGLLYAALRQALGPWAAVAFTAVLFALVHQPWVVQPPLFLLGVALALLAETTGSVLPCIAGHVAFNALPVAQILVS